MCPSKIFCGFIGFEGVRALFFVIFVFLNRPNATRSHLLVKPLAAYGFTIGKDLDISGSRSLVYRL